MSRHSSVYSSISLSSKSSSSSSTSSESDTGTSAGAGLVKRARGLLRKGACGSVHLPEGIGQQLLKLTLSIKEPP
ncbi:hypothetical protein DPMN_168195 [Dreissena polymorpha]|uniref:Uncharacterized protein n=1 Tax=Dreissena polymorpha TaxID=45954 RepID=A0A9D4F1B4_DREPO|nr:hypothetical protein DPMN_168195 [Dreissena polymorpha]